MIAEIVKIEIVKTKSGVPARRIVLKCEDGIWANDYIMKTANEQESAKWWSLIGEDYGWGYFASSHADRLTGLFVNVNVEEGKFGWNVAKLLGTAEKAVVAAPTAPTAPTAPPAPTAAPPDDDIPF